MKAELKKGMRYTDLDNGYLFLVACIIMLFGSFLLLPFEDKMPEHVWYGIGIAFPYLLIGGFLVFFTLKFKLFAQIGDQMPDIMQVFLMLPIFLCMYPIAAFLTRLSAILIPQSDLIMSEEILGYLDKLGPLVGWLILAVLPAIVEELLFRGFIFGSMRNYGWKCAVIISALCFALFHMNVQQELYAFACGLIFAFVREYTGSLYPSMILHTMFNSISVLSVYNLRLRYDSFKPTALDPTGEFVCYGILTVGAIVGLYFFFKLLKKHSSYELEEPSEEFSYKKIRLGYVFGIGMCLLITVFTLMP